MNTFVLHFQKITIQRGDCSIIYEVINKTLRGRYFLLFADFRAFKLKHSTSPGSRMTLSPVISLEPICNVPTSLKHSISPPERPGSRSSLNKPEPSPQQGICAVSWLRQRQEEVQEGTQTSALGQRNNGIL